MGPRKTMGSDSSVQASQNAQLRDEGIGAHLVGGDAYSGGHQRSALRESQIGDHQLPPAVERQVLSDFCKTVLSDFLLTCIVKYCQLPLLFTCIGRLFVRLCRGLFFGATASLVFAWKACVGAGPKRGRWCGVLLLFFCDGPRVVWLLSVTSFPPPACRLGFWAPVG